MKKIPLTGKYSQYSIAVDDEDYEKIKQHKWYGSPSPTGKIYANTYINKRKVLIHRLLLNPSKKKTVDHINGNPLDNRKENLRICSFADNRKNNPMYKNNTTGYKGVTCSNERSRITKPYRATISVEGKCVKLGWFSSPERAHEKYLDARKYYYGEFA